VSTRKPSGSAHVRTRILKDGSVRYYILAKEDGKQRTIKGGLKTVDEVQAYLAAYYIDRARAGLDFPDDSGITTVRQLGILYLAAISPRTRKTDSKRWRARVETAEFIDWPLTQLSEQAVRRWIDTMARTEVKVGKAKGKRPSRGTLGTALAVLRSALKHGVIEGLIDRNVAKNVTIGESTMAAPKGTAAGDGFEYLYEPEVKRILEAKKLPERARTAYTLLAFTGARPMDLYLLDWEQVDISASTIRYWSHKRDRYYVVHMLPQALQVLRAWWIKAGQPKTGLVFPGPKGKPHTDGYDWGWADTSGRRHNYWEVDGEKKHSKAKKITIRKGWRSKIGIERDVPLYSLRHTCASHLLLGTKLFTGGRRWSMEEVASQLGHADLSTVRRYCVALGIMSLGAVEESRALLTSEKAGEMLIDINDLRKP
jgi:integrase